MKIHPIIVPQNGEFAYERYRRPRAGSPLLLGFKMMLNVILAAKTDTEGIAFAMLSYDLYLSESSDLSFEVVLPALGESSE
jgi:hypothetical protein